MRTVPRNVANRRLAAKRAAAAAAAETAAETAAPDTAAPETAAPEYAHPEPASEPPSTTALPPSLAARRVEIADADEILVRASGSDDPRVQGWLADDARFALDLPAGMSADETGDRACAALAAMCALKPVDIVGGMLAAQMVAVHSAALGCLRRAAEMPAPMSARPGPADRPRDAEMRHAARLLRVFERQLAVRDDSSNRHVTDTRSGWSASLDNRDNPIPHIAPLRDRGTGVTEDAGDTGDAGDEG